MNTLSKVQEAIEAAGWVFHRYADFWKEGIGTTYAIFSHAATGQILKVELETPNEEDAYRFAFEAISQQKDVLSTALLATVADKLSDLVRLSSMSLDGTSPHYLDRLHYRNLNRR